MKILQINSHYNQGGAARIVACIHRQLLEDGVEAYVAYGRGNKSDDANVYCFNKTPEVYLSALLSRLTGICGWFNRAAARRLIAYIERIKPDVIHLHALHGYYLNLPILFAYINAHEIPCVWTFHDCYAFTGNCGYFFECDRWQNGCGNCPHIQNYPKSQWFDFSGWMWKRKKDMFTKGAEKVIVTPSDWLTGEARKSFLGKYECLTIRNGIEVKDVFYPRGKAECRRKYGYGQEDRLILGIAVGYDDPRKGAKYIIHLAKNLSHEAKVILIGWSDKNNWMLEGTTNVITLPRTSSPDMLAEYYSMADVFVLPSLAENYATVTLEAMACGTPVVGFKAGGIPEQLTQRKGIAVDVGDQQAFDAAVRVALGIGQETSEREVIQPAYSVTGVKCGEEDTLLRGQELAEQICRENSTEKMTGEYKQLYQRLAQGKGRPT